MKKLSYTILFSVLLSIFTIVSCDDLESDDKEAPEIFDIRFNMNDVIINITEEDGQERRDTIYLNDSLKDYSKPDTLIIGHPLTFSGRFADNEGLSSVMIHIWGDTNIVDHPAGLCYNTKKVPVSNMSKKRSDTLRRVVLVDPIPSTIKNKENETFPIRTIQITEKDEYFFSVRCIDMAGNEDSTTYEKKQIYLMTREEFLEANGY